MRLCANCGEEKENLGSKVCTNGNFVCDDCVKEFKDETIVQDIYDSIIDLINGKISGRYCPICNSKLY